MGTRDEGQFMVAVGAIIENSKTGNILLLKRTPKADFSPESWEEITGRMKQGEELEEALRREVFEESGLKDFEVIKPLSVVHFYRGEKKAENELVLIIYWCRTNEEESAVTLSEEHTEFRWLPSKEAIDFVDHPGIKKDIERFVEEVGRESKH